MKFANTILAAVAILAVAGTAAVAAGTLQDRHKTSLLHEITVSFPGGGVEHIRYTGNIPPEVIVADGPALSISQTASPFWPEPTFADFDRVFASTNRFWASFDKQMSDLIAADRKLIGAMADANKPLLADFAKVPVDGYSYVSSSVSTNGACTQMVKITQRAGEAKPQIVSQTSGDCGKSRGNATVKEDVQADHLTPINAQAPKHEDSVRQTL